MAITDAYATPGLYRSVFTNKISAADDVSLTASLVSNSRLMEEQMGCFYTKDDAAVDRTFIAKSSTYLDLTYEGNCPGIATTTGLAIKVDTDNDGLFTDETAWSVGDYELAPLDADKGPEPHPWDTITVPRYSSKAFVIGSRVQVTAVFGWPSVPEVVVQACIQLTGILRGESPRATNQFTDLGNILSSSRDARDILASLKQAYPAKVTF